VAKNYKPKLQAQKPAFEQEAAHKTLVKLSPIVNFTNILHAAFCTEVFSEAFL